MKVYRSYPITRYERIMINAIGVSLLPERNDLVTVEWCVENFSAIARIFGIAPYPSAISIHACIHSGIIGLCASFTPRYNAHYMINSFVQNVQRSSGITLIDNRFVKIFRSWSYHKLCRMLTWHESFWPSLKPAQIILSVIRVEP